VSRPSFGELGGQDPYDILELPRGASDADVRGARKRLLRTYHPDLPGGDLRRTQLITAAADLLLDPLRRIGYYDLRDEESRHTVFATGDRADDVRPGAGPSIRPTFLTPPARTGPEPAVAGHWYARHTTAPGYTAGAEAPGYAPSAATEDQPSPPADDRPGPDSTEPAAVSRWNALAVASVVAILTWTPIPLVLGLLALRQIRRYGQRGAGLARTGVFVGAVFVLVYVYVLLIAGF
jgi:hypothetical protein